MVTLTFANTTFGAIVQALSGLSLILAISEIVRGRPAAFFWSGTFLALANTRFFPSLININIALILFGVWLVFMLTPLFQNIYPLNVKIFLRINRLLPLFFSFGYIFFVCIFNDFTRPNDTSSASLKSFILILSPYFFLLPIAVVQANQKHTTHYGGNYFIRGLQLGLAVSVFLLHIFSPSFSSIRGVLGESYINATGTAIACSYGILFSFCCIVYDKTFRWMILDAAYLVFFSFSLVSTHSRGALIAVIAGLLAAMLASYRSNKGTTRQRMWIGIVLGCFVCSFIVWKIPSILEARDAYIDTRVDNAIWNEFSRSRYMYAQEVFSLEKINDVWLVMGHGLGASAALSQSLGAHRVEIFWLESLYDIGVVGTALLIYGLFLNCFFGRQAVLDQGKKANDLYIALFVFTCFLSPTSYGWFINGSFAAIHVMLMYFACEGVRVADNFERGNGTPESLTPHGPAGSLP